MSLIFDALQRAEADRSGVDVSTLPAATEILKRAELRVASERRAIEPSNQANVARTAESEMSLRLQVMSPNATAPDVSGYVELPLNRKHLDVFGQFSSRQIAIPRENVLVSLQDSEGLAAEEFRFLGVRLEHLRRDRPLKKMLITSTIPQEGKSVVSANLACTLARNSQQRTLLVEGDVRRPALSQMFGLEPIPGICEYLKDERPLITSIYSLQDSDLWFLPAGNAPKNSLELLQSGRLPAMLDLLTTWFDWIVIDSPPVIPLADTSVWMRLADGILLVVRQGITEKKQLERGLDALEQKKVIGAVLNGSKRPARRDYYYSNVAR
jgi:capsular exopolysaccharide synthesis family protein